MNSVLKLCLLLLIFIYPAFAYPGEVSGVVSYVVDGDTIDVADFGRVRFADIDTPEMDTQESPAAKQYLRRDVRHPAQRIL